MNKNPAQTFGTVYSTSDLMKIFKIGRNTLRLYESLGLLTDLNRTENGYRTYSEGHISNLKFIVEAKAVGFTLAEIKSLLLLFKSQKKMTCGTVSLEIQQKSEEIEFQIQKLQAKRMFMNQFLQTCKSKEKQSSCNVIDMGFTSKACC